MIKHLITTAAFVLYAAVTLVAQQKTTTLTPLCEGFYVHTTWLDNIPSNGIVAETEKGVVLIDTGWDTTTTRELLDLIAVRIRKPVLLCIVTHFHMDRVGGIATLKARNIKVVGTSQTAALAVKEGHVPPEGVLPPDTIFTVDGLQLASYYPGPGHAPDNIVVWFPFRKVLVGGCFIKSTVATQMGNLADANLQLWPESLRKVQQRFPDPQYVIPGHDSWSGTNAIEHTLDMISKHK